MNPVGLNQRKTALARTSNNFKLQNHPLFGGRPIATNLQLSGGNKNTVKGPRSVPNTKKHCSLTITHNITLTLKIICSNYHNEKT
jgi:hypothetical protein